MLNFPFLAPKNGKISVFLAQVRFALKNNLTENGFVLVTVRFAIFRLEPERTVTSCNQAPG